MSMDVRELRPGLWRWTAPHPDWKPEKDRPGGWGQMVGCVYCEPPDTAEKAPTILIDPLAPPEGTADARRFWQALDEDVARRGRGVAVLLGNHYHQRHAQEMLGRYGTSHGVTVWAHEAARGRVACRVERTFSERTTLPGGVVALPIAGLDEPETAFWLPPHRALVFSDALIGVAGGEDGPGVRVAPVSWAPETPEGAARYHAEFRASLRRLLDLPVEMLVVSHGEPVLHDGARRLAAALESPAWGD